MTGEAPFISYAQHGEDVILWRALGDRTDRFYVDVGAFHPTHDSVTRALYERGWRGVNIEPQPGRLDAFLQERPGDTNLSLAIGDADGDVELTMPENPGWASILAPTETGADPSASRRVTVPLRRLDTLFVELGIEHVDVLKIDVEGAEPAVVRGLLGGQVRPTVCVVEGVAPGVGRDAGEEAVRLLTDAGYHHCLFDGLNHYLTTNPELRAALATPASPVDHYVPELVHRLLTERSQLHETIATLVTDNLALRAAAMSGSAPRESADVPGAVSGEDAPGAHDRSTPADGGADGAPRTPEPAFSGGDLPLPTEIAPVSEVAALAVPTAAVPQPPAGRLGLPPRPEPIVDETVRARRRRATFVRSLSSPTAALPAALSADIEPQLDPSLLAACTPAEAVEVLYQAVLGRSSDAEGLNLWTARIEAGVPVLAIARALAASAEAQGRPLKVRRRVASDLAAWASREVLDELGVAIATPSRGFRPGHAAQEIFVDALYEVALQRRPTAAEREHEVAKLAAGVGREWLLRAFAARPEARSRLLGVPRTGVRGTVRAWLDRHNHLDAFRSLVEAAESRQVAQMLAHLNGVDATVRSAARAAGTREER